MADNAPAPDRQPRSGSRIFSQRLEEFLDKLREGQTPNAGLFCSYCYNPLPRSYKRCDHCHQDLAEREPITSLPVEIVQMYRRKLKRESVIVNSFAYVGLALGLALFLGMVAINVIYLDRALWFFIIATIVFLVGSRVMAGLLGGLIGDEIGFRVANRHLAEDWAEYVTAREAGRRTPDEPLLNGSY